MTIFRPRMLDICDAATVREGLTHVLGGGISQVWRPEYPAPLLFNLLVVVEANDFEYGEAMELTLSIRAIDGSPTGIDELTAMLSVDPGAGNEDGDGPTTGTVMDVIIPFVVNVTEMVVPAAGTYEFDVKINGAEFGKIRFTALVSHPPAAM